MQHDKSIQEFYISEDKNAYLSSGVVLLWFWNFSLSKNDQQSYVVVVVEVVKVSLMAHSLRITVGPLPAFGMQYGF